MNTILCGFADGTVLDFSRRVPGVVDLKHHLLPPLAREHRFGGQIPWSVLQHSLLVGRLAKHFESIPSIVCAAYVHDLHEALVRDVPTPVKKAVGPQWYKMEHKVQAGLLRSIGVPDYVIGVQLHSTSVVQFDTAALHAEAQVFFPSGAVMEYFTQGAREVRQEYVAQAKLEISKLVVEFGDELVPEWVEEELLTAIRQVKAK